MTTDIYKAAVDKWGVPAQMNMMVEECAEAILAIRHWDRKRISTEKMVEEFVDVFVMVNQMKYIFPKEFQKMLAFKTMRLEKRLAK